MKETKVFDKIINAAAQRLADRIDAEIMHKIMMENSNIKKTGKALCIKNLIPQGYDTILFYKNKLYQYDSTYQKLMDSYDDPQNMHMEVHSASGFPTEGIAVKPADGNNNWFVPMSTETFKKHFRPFI